MTGSSSRGRARSTTRRTAASTLALIHGDDAPGDDPRPQAGHGRRTTSTTGRTSGSRSRRCPRSSRSTRQVAAPRRAVEGRGGRPQHVAHPRRGRGAPDRRRRSRPRPACPTTTRSASAASGCGARSRPPSRRCRGSPRRREGAAAMTLHLRLRTLELPLRDPFVIARASHGEGRRITTVVAELRDEADGPDGPVGMGEGYPDRVLRRHARDDGRRRAAVARRARRRSRPTCGARSTTCARHSRMPRA